MDREGIFQDSEVSRLVRNSSPSSPSWRDSRRPPIHFAISRRLSWGVKESLLFRGFSGEINNQLWRNSSHFLRFLSSYEHTNRQNSNVSKGNCKHDHSLVQRNLSFWNCFSLHACAGPLDMSSYNFVSFATCQNYMRIECFLADSLLYLKNKRTFCQ